MTEPCLLLVDADVLVRASLADYLRSCGYIVLEASTADEARAIVLHRQARIDAALIDAYRPSTQAFALANWLRREHGHIKVVLAGTVAKSAREASDLCEDGPSIDKPYNHQAVLDQIRRLLAERGRKR